jgi:PilZ domain
MAIGAEAVCILTRAGRRAAAKKNGLVEPPARWETRAVQRAHSVASPPPAEHRRHLRMAASWPVTIQAGPRLLRLQALNVSALGVKVGLDEPLAREPLEVGRAARLRLEPPGAPPLEVEAIVWRTDADGPAFFFVGTPSHPGPAPRG